jgi:hypothetical protein
MDPSDSKYGKISAQNFISISPELALTSEWVDPKNLEPVKPDEIKIVDLPERPSPRPDKIKNLSEPQSKSKPAAKIQDLSEPQPKSPPQTAKIPDAAALTNTPVQQGQMIPQENKSTNSTPSKDSWDSPVPTSDTDGVRVVKPGEKIKLS